MWATILFATIGLLFAGWAVSVLWHLQWVQRLPRLPDHASEAAGAPRRCSVVVAARDEEARIERTIHDLLAQRGVSIEVIAVDDRSTDRTGEILRRLAARDDRLRTVRVERLPAGWLGKCHACHVGAAEATGDWILFADGDCWLHPDVIDRAIRTADCEGVDHVTLTSGLAYASAALKASHVLFHITLSNWFSGVNRDRPGAFMGIGAFNLVRAPIYRRCGGHPALRLTVLDDMKLGLLIRRAGGRTRAFIGAGEVECDWGKSALGMIRIMEKNCFAAVDYRTGLVVAGAGGVSALGVLILAGLTSGSGAGLAAALSPALIALPAGVLARRLGWSAWTALLVPSMLPIFGWTLLHSTLTTLRQGGVRWRDTFYPLEELRARNVQ